VGFKTCSIEKSSSRLIFASGEYRARQGLGQTGLIVFIADSHPRIVLDYVIIYMIGRVLIYYLLN
jgi:hypothetical protein